MSRVLVTGGAGFIGSFVVDRLRAAGHEAVIFDVRRSPHHARGEVPTVIGDVLDLRALRKAARGCDAVAHLAAAADVGEVASDPQAAEQLNSRGTFNVLEAARAEGVPRVIYASTVWVYSEASGDVDEDVALLPPAHLYTATKLAGELYCRSYSELYGVETTILRFGIPYGPRARPAAVVPSFVQKALRGEALSIAGTGEQTRRFVYVEDLAEGVVRALAPVAANRTYNLVGSEDVSIRQIADTVRTLVGEVEIEHTPGRAGDFNGGADISGARAGRELDWHPDTEFRDGVARYVAWHERYEAPPTPATARLRERLATSRVAVALDRAWERMGLALMVLALLIGVVLHTLTASTTDAVKDIPHHRTTLILIVVAIVSGAAAARARRSDRDRQTDTAG